MLQSIQDRFDLFGAAILIPTIGGLFPSRGNEVLAGVVMATLAVLAGALLGGPLIDQNPGFSHVLLEELADAQLAGTRKAYLAAATSVPLLIIDDLGMRKLPSTAAEDLLEIVMRRYERAATLLTSNRPVEDWGKLLGDTAAVTALLDRVLHHAHVLTCGPRSWRTRLQSERNAS
jgi:hypothetical protein